MQMRITVFGAAGGVGRQVVAEAHRRGHDVTAVSRRPAAGLVRGDAGNVEDVVILSGGRDLVIGATRPAPGSERELVTTTRALLAGLARTGTRLLLVGGAATLTVPGTGGGTVLDDPALCPPAWHPIARASALQLAVCRAATHVDWAYLSPPALLVPGERTGRYRLGADELLIDREGRSTISTADLAVALLDEAERPQHHGARFTVAY